MGAIALVLLLAGGLTALSNVVTTTALPFLIILTSMCYSLFQGLRTERAELTADAGVPTGEVAAGTAIKYGSDDRSPSVEEHRHKQAKASESS